MTTLFLDRDGVINVKIENGYVLSIEDFVFLPGVISALRVLRPLFDLVIVVTNQRCIAKGLLTIDGLQKIHLHMITSLEKEGIFLDAIYFCPHMGGCPCRKPNIGMALMAKRDFPSIDFSKSVVVGDSGSDIEFGRRIGAFTVSVGKGSYGADLHCSSLLDFALRAKEVISWR